VKKASLRFQSRDFDFPKNAYIGCVAMVDTSNKKRYLCLTRIFDNLEILRPYVLFVIDDLLKSAPYITPIYEGFYIKCRFSRFFPLNRSHWGKNHAFEMDIFQKFRNDVNIVKYWKMSEVLITPDGEIDGVEFYSFCISLFKNTENMDVDTYIKNSNHVVDIRAKNAAFYSLCKPIKINWLGNAKNYIANKISGNYIN
jgi:hypothetical protein